MCVTVAIVLGWAGSVESYQAAGRQVGPSAPPDCPRCQGPTVFWSGYERELRLAFDPDAAVVVRIVRIWVRRVHCRHCRTTPGLLPAFCLSRRLDEVAVIGVALARVVEGRAVAEVAQFVAVARSTARGWVGRFQQRAVAVAATFASLALSWGSGPFDLPVEPTRAALVAVGRAYAAAHRRLAGNVVALWCFVAAVSGGALLTTNRSPP